MKKILYIEDNMLNIRLIKKTLKNMGYEIITAMDGETGIQAAMTQNPDLILLDLNLPDIYGVDVAKRIQANATTRRVPIVAITADATDATRKICVESGFAAYIMKPAGRAEIMSTIIQLLDASEEAMPSKTRTA